MSMESVVNIDQLKKELAKIKVPASYYRIGSYGEEALCILSENNQWLVFEGERGLRYNTHFFDRESDACSYFWDRIKAFL